MEVVSKYKAKKKVRPIQVRWNEKLGKEGCSYARRWVLNFGIFSIRVHNFMRSDDKRFFHDHGWSFLTIVLRGGYIDVSPDGKDKLTVGSIRYRKDEHKHYVKVEEIGCWTLLFTGPNKRKWGFWVDGKFRRPLKYFYKWGHPERLRMIVYIKQ